MIPLSVALTSFKHIRENEDYESEPWVSGSRSWTMIMFFRNKIKGFYSFRVLTSLDIEIIAEFQVWTTWKFWKYQRLRSVFVNKISKFRKHYSKTRGSIRDLRFLICSMGAGERETTRVKHTFNRCSIMLHDGSLKFTKESILNFQIHRFLITLHLMIHQPIQDRPGFPFSRWRQIIEFFYPIKALFTPQQKQC